MPRKKIDPTLNQNLLTGTLETSSDDSPPAGMPTEKARPRAQQKLIDDLTGWYTGIGALFLVADPTVGMLIMQGANQRATELVDVARHHPKMMKSLQNMVKDSDYMALIMGHGGMIFTILQHFGVIPSVEKIAEIVGQTVSNIRTRMVRKKPAQAKPAQDTFTFNNEEFARMFETGPMTEEPVTEEDIANAAIQKQFMDMLNANRQI